MLRLSRRSVCTALVLAAADDAPLPTEFLIFKKGKNETTKGTYIFNAAAAKSVMGAFRAQGVDYIVDREHDSLNEYARAARKDAGDALAHYTLELRNGDLWATNVVWNAEGESDLRAKKRRYTSPAFNYNEDTGEIVELINVGLVSMPATHENAPLIAARRRLLSTGASMNEIQDAVGAALNAKYPPASSDSMCSLYVCDLYDGAAIFNREGLLYSIPYTYASGAATLTGEPIQVVRTYTPATAAIAARAARLIAQVKKGKS